MSFCNFFKGIQKIADNKALIRSVIGEKYAIAKDFNDFSGLFSIKNLFKRFPTHYCAFEGKSSKRISLFEDRSYHIALDYDKSKNIEKMMLFDTEKHDVSIYDSLGCMVKYYSPEETYALQLYKHNSKNFHKVMRYGQHVNNETEIRNAAEVVSNAFAHSNKVSKAKEDFIVYRALDKRALNEILSMQSDGMIYIEPSILSAATNKKSTLQFLTFKNFNHRLRLKVKKDTEYINLDEASYGHIVIPQMPENELIFKPGTKILITNRHAKGGFIDAEIIN